MKFLLFALAAAAAQATAPPPWPVVGQQGMVHTVIVPLSQAQDAQAYRQQITRLCADPDRSCFLNFYTNSTNAPAALPLPDAIGREATAVYRRSAKQNVERFQWRCGVGAGVAPNCF